MAYAPMTGEWEYVLREDRKLPPGEQTTWILGSLTFRDMEDVLARSLAVGDDGEVVVTTNAQAQARRILNRGLRGWKNYRRQDGTQIEFRAVDEGDRRILPEEVLDSLHPYAIELANAITEHSRMTERLEKNSSSP